MAYSRDMFTNILNRSWMVGLPTRVQNVIAAYGADNPKFSKSVLIADVQSGVFLKRAINAGPKTVTTIKEHFKIEEQCLT